MLYDSKSSSSSSARNFLLALCLALDVCWLRGVAEAGVCGFERRVDDDESWWKNCDVCETEFTPGLTAIWEDLALLILLDSAREPGFDMGRLPVKESVGGIDGRRAWWRRIDVLER